METETLLAPTLLIASPQLSDPFFEGALVLLWHHDEDGAIGVVVNKPMPQSVDEVVSIEDMPDLQPHADSRVSWGGPVETDSGTVITSGGIEEDEGWELDCGLSVTRSQDALIRLLKSQAHLLLCIGYAGWGPGQLDKEIQEGGWLFADVDPNLVLNGEPTTAYDRALATLGLTPTTVWMMPIDE